MFALSGSAAAHSRFSFDDSAVADYFDVDGRCRSFTEHFARIWIHTHPGNSPQPSLMDLRTFATSFGQCDWSVMMILAEDDSTSLACNSEPVPVAPSI